MSNLNELHQTAVETAEAARKLQARMDGEITEENLYGTRETSQALRAAKKVHGNAMTAFQNEVDALGVQNVPSLKELYAQIGDVRL